MSEPTEIAGDQLRTIVERIEHVDEEIKELTEAKKEIFVEAKGNGFDVKVIREVIRVRKRIRRSVTSWKRFSTSTSRQSSRSRLLRKLPEQRSIAGAAVLASHSASNASFDRMDDAAKGVARLREIKSVARIRQFPFQEPRYSAKYAEALRKAGFPE